jgi:hypothetical protein
VKFIIGRRPAIRANVIQQIRVNSKVWGYAEILYYIVYCLGFFLNEIDKPKYLLTFIPCFKMGRYKKKKEQS